MRLKFFYMGFEYIFGCIFLIFENWEMFIILYGFFEDRLSCVFFINVIYLLKY